MFPIKLILEENKRSALKGFTTHHTIKPLNNTTFDPESFLNAAKQNGLETFKPQTKVRIVLRADMKHNLPTAEAQSVVETQNFQSKTYLILESTNKDKLWSEMREQVLENLATFLMKGSDWTCSEVLSLDIHTLKYKPFRGGSWYPLANFLAAKGALINMKNGDNFCF